VEYRESWDPEVARKYDRSKSDDDRAQGNYYRAALMSTDAEQRRYEAFYRSEQSPVKVLGDNAKAHVKFRGTTLLRPGVALVRYERVVERTGAVQPEVTHHTATVNFGYSNGRISERDRAIDPLGFQASEYRTDPDVPEAVPVVATPTPYPTTLPPAAPASGAPVAAPLDLRPLQARGQ
jgi:type IV secretion system protein VirB8